MMEVGFTTVNSVWMFPRAKCPTCVCAYYMELREKGIPFVDCSYFDSHWTAACLWCMGYSKATDAALTARVEALNVQGYYREAIKDG